jgi:hypothetical protein
MAGNVYVGQTDLEVNITILDQDGAAVDLTEAASVVLKYRDPDCGTGSWPVTITDAGAGQVQWKPGGANDLGTHGNWVLWPHITFNDSTEIAAAPNTLLVLREGEAPV